MNRPLPPAILLDLDDTILDDSSYVVRCWREACFAHAPELDGVDPGALHDTIERVRSWYWGHPERHREGRLDMEAARREVVRMSLAEVGREDPEIADKIAAWYGAQRHQNMQPLPEAIETIRWLRECGCRLALVTNGSGAAQRAKIARFRLEEYFDHVLIEGEMGYGKPDTRVYELALTQLGVESTDAWMVGDNLEWDVAAPQRVGIFGVWIDSRGDGLPPGRNVRPDRIIRRLSELRASA
jgi:putative hydrolase of the HAD superfamily